MRQYVSVLAITTIGIILVTMLLLLVPNIEQSRTETQLSIAFDETQRLRRELIDKESLDSATTLPDLDPWGQPYHVVPLDAGAIRVLSSGPNKSFSPEGIEKDDIYSDMPVSPAKMIQARKKRQWLITMVAGVNGCVLAAVIYYLWRRHASLR